MNKRPIDHKIINKNGQKVRVIKWENIKEPIIQNILEHKDKTFKISMVVIITVLIIVLYYYNLLMSILFYSSVMLVSLALILENPPNIATSKTREVYKPQINELDDTKRKHIEKSIAGMQKKLEGL